MLVALAEEGEIAVLVIEQNIGVATAVSDHVAIMVNGRINRIMEARALAADRELQQRLSGVGRHADDDAAGVAGRSRGRRRAARRARSSASSAAVRGRRRAAPTGRRLSRRSRNCPTAGTCRSRPAAPDCRRQRRSPSRRPPKLFAMPLAERIGRTVLVAGTFDTKGKELRFIADRLKALGIPVRTVDLSTSGKPSSADVPAAAGGQRCTRCGTSAGDLGRSRPVGRGHGGGVRALDRARAAHRRRHLGRRLGRHHAGHGRHAARCRSAFPRSWSRPSRQATSAAMSARADIMMFHSVADVQGLNSITEQVLANAAHAMAGMVAQLPTAEALRSAPQACPAGGRHHHVRRHHALPCRRLTKRLEAGLRLPGLPRHRHRRTVDGGPRRFAAAGSAASTSPPPRSPTCWSAASSRRPRPVRRAPSAPALPYVGSVGALDMVNFGPRDTRAGEIPQPQFRHSQPQCHADAHHARREPRHRRLDRRAAQRDERAGALPAAARAACPCSTPRASRSTIRRPTTRCSRRSSKTVRQSAQRRVERVPANINDPAFVEAVVAAFHAVAPQAEEKRVR